MRTVLSVNRTTYAVLSSNNFAMDGKINGSHVGYSTVIKKVIDSLGNAIKEETVFNNIEADETLEFSFPFPPVYDIDYKL